MSLINKILEAKENLVALYNDDKMKTQEEEKVLFNASTELDTLNNLKLESDIESKRAVRKYVIQRQEEIVKELQENYNNYVLSLPAKTASAYNIRKNKYFEEWKKTLPSHLLSNNYFTIYSGQLINYPQQGIWESRNPDPPPTFISGQVKRLPLALSHLQSIAVLTRDDKTPYERSSVGYNHQKDSYKYEYGISIEKAFDIIWQAYSVDNLSKHITSNFKSQLVSALNQRLSGESWNHTIYVFPLSDVISILQKGDLTKATLPQNSVLLISLVNWLFPSVNSYMNNPDLYPMASGFMEETPWPTPKQLNNALKPLLKIGSGEWGEKQIEHLKEIASFNMKDDEATAAAIKRGEAIEENYRKQGIVNTTDWVAQNLNDLKYNVLTLALPNGYVMPDGNFKEVKTFNLVNLENPDSNIDPANEYYSPRPKNGFVYVPGFDYINPLQYVPIKDREVKVNTPEGDYVDAVEKAKREAEKQARADRWNLLKSRISAISSGGIAGMIFNPTSFVESIACAGFGEDHKVCSYVKDLGAVTRTGIQLWVASAVGYATGGVGASIAGAVSAVASAEGLNIGNSDLGKVLLALSEAYAIATVTNSAIDKALTEVLENQIYAITKREIGKATGLDQTLLGRVGLDLTTGGAFRMYKGEGFTDAITGSADKAWRMSVARENPYGAILMAGVTEVEKNGWSIDSTNPLDWFDNISLSSEASRIRKSIRGKDVAKIIGLTYMVSAGKISESDALLLIGQEASKRNIEKFYHDKPIQEDPEMAAYRQKQAEVGRWKQGIQVMKKLSTGVPPTKDDIMVISDNVAGPIYDRVKALGLPTSVEVNLWQIAIGEVGLPNLTQYTPDVSFTMPDWMKSSKSSGEVIFTNQAKMEEYVNNKFTEGAQFTKEDLVILILGLFPRNVPLVPLAQVPTAPTFNWIDEFGNLKIRDPLKFPYDHPMLRVGNIKKKYSKEQLEYIKAREEELKQAQIQMQKLQAQLAQLQSQA